MNYTNEELEHQITSCMRNLRERTEQLRLEEARSHRLRLALKMKSEAYHIVCNIFNNDRHQGHWLECTEGTCQDIIKLLQTLEFFTSDALIRD